MQYIPICYRRQLFASFSLQLKVEKKAVKFFDLIFVAVEIRAILLCIEIIKRYFSLSL